MNMRVMNMQMPRAALSSLNISPHMYPMAHPTKVNYMELLKKLNAFSALIGTPRPKNKMMVMIIGWQSCTNNPDKVLPKK